MVASSWVGEGRYESTLSDFSSDLTEAQRNQIEAVAVDMSPPYRHGLNIWCPHAAVVYDFFHMVAKYGREVIDVIRAQQVKRFTGPDREFVKGSRYLLLRNRADLKPEQRTQLHALLEVNEPLAIAYLLKDQLKKIWTYTSEGWAQRAVLQWAALAFANGLKPSSDLPRACCVTWMAS